MRPCWALLYLAVHYVWECLLSLATPFAIMVCLQYKETPSMVWLGLCVSWWFLTYVGLNYLFWKELKDREFTGLSDRLYCLLGGFLWRLYMLINGQKIGENEELYDLLRIEALSMRMCSSYFQSFPIIFVCQYVITTRDVTYPFALLSMILTTVLTISLSTSVLFLFHKVEEPSLTKLVTILDLHIVPTPTDTTLSVNAVKLSRILSAIQASCFQISRLLVATSLCQLVGVTLFLAFVLVRMCVTWFYLARNMRHELGLTSWDLQKHGVAICRLTYLSYLTCFDWFVDRDGESGTSLRVNVRQCVTYHGLAMIETIAVAVAWSVSTCQTSQSLTFQGVEFATIGFALNAASVVLVILIVTLFNRGKRHADVKSNFEEGVCNLAMDYSDNCDTIAIPEPPTSPKNTSSYVDFKDLDDDQIVLFSALPVPRPSSPTKTSSRKQVSPVLRGIAKRTQTKMGLQSLLLKGEATVTSEDFKGTLRPRRKSYETISMVSQGEFSYVNEDRLRLPFIGSQLSVESLRAPYARSIRTMSWPMIGPPAQDEFHALETTMNTPEQFASSFVIPRITCESEDDIECRANVTDDVVYV